MIIPFCQLLISQVCNVLQVDNTLIFETDQQNVNIQLYQNNKEIGKMIPIRKTVSLKVNNITDFSKLQLHIINDKRSSVKIDHYVTLQVNQSQKVFESQRIRYFQHNNSYIARLTLYKNDLVDMHQAFNNKTLLFRLSLITENVEEKLQTFAINNLQYYYNEKQNMIQIEALFTCEVFKKQHDEMSKKNQFLEMLQKEITNKCVQVSGQLPQKANIILTLQQPNSIIIFSPVVDII